MALSTCEVIRASLSARVREVTIYGDRPDVLGVFADGVKSRFCSEGREVKVVVSEEDPEAIRSDCGRLICYLHTEYENAGRYAGGREQPVCS